MAHGWRVLLAVVFTVAIVAGIHRYAQRDAITTILFPPPVGVTLSTVLGSPTDSTCSDGDKTWPARVTGNSVNCYMKDKPQ